MSQEEKPSTDEGQSQVDANRAMLEDAQQRGVGPTLGVYMRLSGPGWLQSAITLGGGSLAGALFLGVLGGTSMLWLQLVAIIMGVVMLSAISYVTLSTKERPFQSINRHINPVLGWGWLIATVMANMIWCMPQFSLCFAALQKNLVGPSIDDDSKMSVSAVLLVVASIVVLLNQRQGLTAKIFDWFLKALVGMIVICFFGVVIYLGSKGHLNWGQIFAGFIPDFSQWSQPSGDVAKLIAGLPESDEEYWSSLVVKEQRAVMIGAAATAVGINMTFLMPYTMLNRGWDKPFRGLSRFDLCTGMAIPYILVTSCVVIASAASFHAQVDNQFLSDKPAEMMKSPIFNRATGVLERHLVKQHGDKIFDNIMNDTSLDTDKKKAEAKNKRIAELSVALSAAERKLAATLVKRDAFQLSKALAPLLGEKNANLVFGLGVFGMGFSSIIILMLINGFAFREMFDAPKGIAPFVIGCLIAGIAGSIWPMVWDGPAKLWLAILTSSFGMMLLPIAYFTFFMMMNSKKILGDEKPTGMRMIVWNVLMIISVVGAVAAAGTAIMDKASDPKAGKLVMGVAIVYILLVGIGFAFKRPDPETTEK